MYWKPWCVRNDWKTKAHSILKGKYLRGPGSCPTLRGWHEEGAEVSSRPRWAMGKVTRRQIGAQRKSFLLLRELLHCWGNLKGVGQTGLVTVEKLWKGFCFDHQAESCIKTPPRSLTTLRFYTRLLNAIIHVDFGLKRKACAVCLGCLPYLFSQKLSSLSFLITYSLLKYHWR